MKPIYLLQDNARELLDDDYLGMKAWFDVIAGTAIGNDGPFTIGIYKEWGYGKTTLLRLAKQTVEEHPEGKNEPVVTVWFNAWQFEREAHPLFPLIAAITDAIEKRVGGKSDDKPSKLKKIGLSLRALIRGMKLSGEVGVPLLGKVGVEFDAAAALTAEDLLGKQTNPLQAELLYHSAFELLGDAAKGAGKAKIVVFIDDLDRCNPENAVRLLENIKLVLAQKGFVFVLAVDNLVIETYLDKIYEEKYGFKAGTGRGRKYLEKIVQLPLEIPPHEKRFPEYVGKLIGELAKKYPKKDLKIDALRTVQKVLADHVGHNPRRLVRLIDGFIIDAFLWEGTAELRTHYRALDKIVASAIAIHRVVHIALGEELTSALIDDHELRKGIADGSFRESKKAVGIPARGVVPAVKSKTLRERLEERLRAAGDILDLLQTDHAKALVLPAEYKDRDLWETVRHFITTTRADAAVEFPAFLADRIREQLNLGEDDPIPAARLSELKRLELRGTQVTDAGLAHLKALAGLQTLALKGTAVTDAGLAHLKGLVSLQILVLNNTAVTDAGLAHLKGLAGLTGLYLGSTQVTGAGLAHLRGLAGLQELYFTNTQVSDAGLAHLKGLTGLQTLWLDNTQVTDAGLPHLKGLAGLQTLWLNDTPVTDAGLAHLQALTGLQGLYLYRTQVTKAGVAALKEALPDCEIHGP